MKGFKNVIFMSLALGMLLYSVPRLDIGGGFTLPTVFGAIWICFALLIIAAHLHELLGVDEETRQEIVRVKRMKRWRMEQRLQGKKMLGLRK
ncbi:hypothetical protein P4H65_10000 [Paenibacillus chitinolyticus]|uniref:hypothetical protein n=1 Tax=Paenibacillus chitinolyticus TaxID=79263 RepID=UPI002DBFAEF8|nr:hypothetical protein [Paenibacillus chitinolyticus]MEC0246116.1 hypothetical protein [Paenibacillus chitinolyticus]